MPRMHPPYPQRFRREAVELVRKSGRAGSRDRHARSWGNRSGPGQVRPGCFLAWKGAVWWGRAPVRWRTRRRWSPRRLGGQSTEVSEPRPFARLGPERRSAWRPTCGPDRFHTRKRERPPGTGRPGVKGVPPAHKKRCQDAVESNRWGLPDSAGWGERLDDCPGQQPVCAWLRFLETRRMCLIRQQCLEENRDGDGKISGSA